MAEEDYLDLKVTPPDKNKPRKVSDDTRLDDLVAAADSESGGEQKPVPDPLALSPAPVITAPFHSEFGRIEPTTREDASRTEPAAAHEPEPEHETTTTASSSAASSISAFPTAVPVAPDSNGHAKLVADTDDMGALRIGIAGGRQTGKTYLFQAMVYRTWRGSKAGVMSGFLGNHDNQVTQGPDLKTLVLNDQAQFSNSYREWTRLEPTAVPTWYQLRLQYRTGLWGTTPAQMNISFLDAPGEDFARNHVASKEFKDARVMMFCLPMWAVFYNRQTLPKKDVDFARDALKDFREIVGRYRQTLEQMPMKPKVRVIVALTMADDIRSSADDVKDLWIGPYVKSATVNQVLKTLSTQGGLSTYLSVARRVSQRIEERIKDHDNPAIGSIPEMVSFGEGTSWFIPMTAINGTRLQFVQEAREAKNHQEVDNLLAQYREPMPAHVELPLLIALCEETNALA